MLRSPDVSRRPTTAQRNRCFVSCPNSSALGPLQAMSTGNSYTQTYPAGDFAITVCAYGSNTSSPTTCCA